MSGILRSRESQTATLTLCLIYVAQSMYMAIAAVYWVEVKGLSTVDLSLLWTVYFAVYIVLDYPTGVLAARFGVAPLIQAGLACDVFALWLFADGSAYWQFVLGECLSAGGVALRSGATHTWFLRVTQDSGGSETARLAHLETLGQLLGLLGGAAGGVVYQYSRQGVWYGGAILFVAVLVLFSYTDARLPERLRRGRADPAAFPRMSTECLKLVSLRPSYRGLLLSYSFIGVIFWTVNLSWQLRFSHFYAEGGRRPFELVWMMICVCSAVGAFLCARLPTPGGRRRATATACVVFSASFLLWWMTPSLAGFVVTMALMTVVRSFLESSLAGAMHEQISEDGHEDLRPAIMSSYSAVANALSAVMMPVIGVFATVRSTKGVVFAAVLVGVAVGCTGLIAKPADAGRAPGRA